MKLDKRLGKWLSVPRNVWFNCYKSDAALFWRDKEGRIHCMEHTGTSGFYTSAGIIEELPIESHPIDFIQIGEKIWTRRPLNLRAERSPLDKPPGHTIENTICDPTCEKATTGSNGSVKLVDQIAAAAWLITHDEEAYISAVFLPSDISSCLSYRTELEGIFRCL